MPFSTSKVKTPVGMTTLDFWPIKAEPDSAHPTYDQKFNLGAAVKGYLTVTTAIASISGDDITQVEDEMFTGGQLDSETTLSDLQINAKLFGHTFSDDSGEESKSTDRTQLGGISFIEPILKKDKSRIYRATCLYRTQAIASSEKQEADTKKPGELNPKMNAVSFKVMEDNLQSWRVRNDFPTNAAAEEFINKVFGATS